MIVYFAVAIAILAVLLLATRKTKRPGKKLPGPAGLPILGCALDLTPTKILDKLAEYSDRYGSTYEFMAVGTRFVVTSDLEVIQDALARRPRTFRRPDTFEGPSKVLGFDTGVFMAEGQDWGRARRLTAPAFSHGNLNALAKTISNVAQSWIAKLKSMHSSDGSILADGMHIFQMLTANVLIRSAFGDSARGTYLDSKQSYDDMNTGFEYLAARVLWPLSEWSWMLLPLPIKLQARIAERRITRACLQLIEKAQESCRTGNDTEIEGTFIKSLIKAKDGTESNRNSLTQEEMMSQIKTFLVAGSETTSNVLTWLLPLVYARPDLLQNIRDEVASFLKSTNGRWPETLEEIKQWRWSEAVMRELLRLHSPAPFIFLQGNTPVELKNGVHLEPSDTLVLRCEAHQISGTKFDRPSEFLPERWLQPHTQEQLDLLSLTFGGGPRICPGMGLAYAEGTLAVGLFVYNFDVELLCDPAKITRVFSFTTKADRVTVRLTPRQI